MIRMNQISNVYSFSVFEEYLAFIKGRKDIVVSKDHGKAIAFQFHSDDNLQDVHLKKDVVWSHTISGKAIIGWANRFHIKNFYIKDYHVYDDSLYTSINKKGAKLDRNENLLWTIEDQFFTFFHFRDFFFYIKEHKYLYALDDSNGQILWEYTPTPAYDWLKEKSNGETPQKKATISQVVGIYENILWLIVISDKISVLGLDLQSGQERYRINKPVCYPPGWSEEEKKQRRPFGNGTQIDVEKGVLFGGFNHYYGEVNLKDSTPTYHLYDFQESYEQHQLRMYQFGAWEGDNIYFWEGASNNRFGIFSREKKSIVWSGQIEEAENTMPAIRKVDYSHGKLYVLDHHFTLHIFQQEG